MNRMRKFVLALSASAMLSLGAVAPAVAGPPDPAENRGIATACDALPEAAATASAVLRC